MASRSPKGVFDIIPARLLRDSKEPWRAAELWQWLESEIRDLARCYHFQEIRTPMFERTELFARGVGEDSDIVTKEMYTFEDKGKRSMTLRPEGTAPVMRAFIDHKLQDKSPINKFFYIAPMFRYERPQSGRYRQHHQFGVEAIGDASPEQDAEVIDLLVNLYRRLGIQELTVQLNTLGSEESRTRFRKALRAHLEPLRDQLSEDSQRRLESNPLRILDSKDEADRRAIAAAPTLMDFLDEGEIEHFRAVQAALDEVGIAYSVQPQLVRGLDYYNGVVFEVVTQSLGAQNSIGGGGRYDGLLKTLGGSDLPACGFGSGMERILQTVLAQQPGFWKESGPQLYFIPLGSAARQLCFRLTHELRMAGLAVEMDATGRKLKKLMSYANSSTAQYTAIVGDDELAAGIVKLKHMESGEETSVPLKELALFFEAGGVAAAQQDQQSSE